MPDDEMYDNGYISTSSENGVTSDMFGLSLPTNETREVAAKLGLPSDYIQEQVRSRTPRRVKTEVSESKHKRYFSFSETQSLHKY